MGKAAERRSWKRAQRVPAAGPAPLPVQLRSNSRLPAAPPSFPSPSAALALVRAFELDDFPWPAWILCQMASVQGDRQAVARRQAQLAEAQAAAHQAGLQLGIHDQAPRGQEPYKLGKLLEQLLPEVGSRRLAYRQQAGGAWVGMPCLPCWPGRCRASARCPAHPSLLASSPRPLLASLCR